MKNFIPAILTKSRTTESPSTSESHIKQEQVQKPEKEVQLKIIIQPIPYEFMLVMDKSLQREADKIVQKRYLQKNEGPHEKVFSNIRVEVRELRKLIEQYSEQEIEIQDLKQQVEQSRQVFMSKELIIKNIESTYMEQIKQMIMRIIEQLTKENEQLKIELQQLKQNNANLLEFNQGIAENVQQLEGKLLLESSLKKQLEQQVETLKDIRRGQINLKNTYSMLKLEYQDNNIYTLLTNKNRNILYEFLDTKDYLSLMLTSKQMYFIVQNNRQLIQLITNRKTSILIQENNRLTKENIYFQEMTQSVPQEIIQIGIAKFLVFKINIGQYMNDVFNEAFDLLDGKNTKQQYQNQYQQPSLQSMDYKGEDLIGLNDHEEQHQQQQQQSSSIFSKIKSLTNNNPQPQRKQTISDLSIQMQQEFRGMDKLILEALQVPFLRVQLQQQRRDMNELVKRSQEFNQQLFQVGLKCIVTSQNPNPKMSVQDYMANLQKIFARLLTNSHYLQLEAQQLNQVCLFFASKLVEQQHILMNKESYIDDIEEQLNGIKLMKSHFQQRAHQLEQRIIDVEDQKLILSKSSYDQQLKIQQLQQDCQQLVESGKEREQTLQNLVQGIKTLKNEKSTVEYKLQSILQQFNNLKHLVPQLLKQQD